MLMMPAMSHDEGSLLRLHMPHMVWKLVHQCLPAVSSLSCRAHARRMSLAHAGCPTTFRQQRHTCKCPFQLIPCLCLHALCLCLHAYAARGPHCCQRCLYTCWRGCSLAVVVASMHAIMYCAIGLPSACMSAAIATSALNNTQHTTDSCEWILLLPFVLLQFVLLLQLLLPLILLCSSDPAMAVAHLACYRQELHPFELAPGCRQQVLRTLPTLLPWSHPVQLPLLCCVEHSATGRARTQ